MAFKLDPGCDIGSEIIRVACDQLAEAAEYVRRRSEPVAERVHAGRTTCKKVRAALRLLRQQDRPRYRWENRWLRDAARKLSALREAETIPAAFGMLLKECATAPQRRKFSPLIRALHAQRDAALAEPKKIERKLARFAEKLEAAQVRLGCWETKNDVASVMAEYRRAYKRARGGLVGAQELGTGTAFHEWRKTAKTYGYQCRLLRAAWPPAMKELRDEVKQLGALLGDEHDLTMLRKTLKRMRKEPATDVTDELLSAVLDAVEKRRDDLRAEAIPLGERLFVDRPRVIAARMTQWWTVAQEDKAK
jgi:CHAD domain-containing protein